jgi:hypothetical protein
MALMMEAAHTSETSVDIYLTTRQYIPEDSKVQNIPCSSLQPKVGRALSQINPFNTLPTCPRSVLISSFHLLLGFPSDLVPSGFPTNFFAAFLNSFTKKTPPPSSFENTFHYASPKMIIHFKLHTVIGMRMSVFDSCLFNDAFTVT